MPCPIKFGVNLENLLVPITEASFSELALLSLLYTNETIALSELVI